MWGTSSTRRGNGWGGELDRRGRAATRGAFSRALSLDLVATKLVLLEDRAGDENDAPCLNEEHFFDDEQERRRRGSRRTDRRTS